MTAGHVYERHPFAFRLCAGHSVFQIRRRKFRRVEHFSPGCFLMRHPSPYDSWWDRQSWSVRICAIILVLAWFLPPLVMMFMHR